MFNEDVYTRERIINAIDGSAGFERLKRGYEIDLYHFLNPADITDNVIHYAAYLSLITEKDHSQDVIDEVKKYVEDLKKWRKK